MIRREDEKTSVPFNLEFFDLPQTYGHSDIRKIHSGVVYSESRGLEPFSVTALKEIHPYREKPFFTCYLAHLDSGR
jgi:hypothetical protein